MADFHCYDENSNYVRGILPDDTFGADEWRALVRQLGDLQPNPQEDPLAPLRRLQQFRPSPKVPRLFVSHRQADSTPALRVAERACHAGFDYWLDILNPTLSGLGAAGTGSPFQFAVATAAGNVSKVAGDLKPPVPETSREQRFLERRVLTTSIANGTAATCWRVATSPTLPVLVVRKSSR